MPSSPGKGALSDNKPSRLQPAEDEKTVTLEQALSIQRELIKGFSDESFQEKLNSVLSMLQDSDKKIKNRGNHERHELIMTVQEKVLTKHGFAGGVKGVFQMMRALEEVTMRGDATAEFAGNYNEINRLLRQDQTVYSTVNQSLDGYKKTEAAKATKAMLKIIARHALKHTEFVTLIVESTDNMQQVKEKLLLQWNRPDLARQVKIVNKEGTTGFFSDVSATDALRENQTEVLVLGVNNFKDLRPVAPINMQQALLLVQSVFNAYSQESVQRELMAAEWGDTAPKAQATDFQMAWIGMHQPSSSTQISKQITVNPKTKGDTMAGLWKSVLPNFGFDGSYEGWQDFQSTMSQYWGDQHFYDYCSGIVSCIDRGDMSGLQQYYGKYHGNSVPFLIRSRGGVFLSNSTRERNVCATGPHEVQCFRTSLVGEKWSQLPALELSQRRPDRGKPIVTVDSSVRYQTIIGFGGSFTESAATLFYSMSLANQARMADAYFSKSTGLGYCLGRTHMNSCDFSTGEWSCCEECDDASLSHFNVERYTKMMFPLMQWCKTVAGDSLMLIASPWSPPSWMKDNDSMLKGGKLKFKYQSSWARFYVRFAEECKAAGLPLWAMTVQNEPDAKTDWENCIYTAEEERDFVKNHLGPCMQMSGLDVKLLFWDHNRDAMLERARVIYADPAASKYVWGLAYHWYGDPRYESWVDKGGMLCYDNVRLVHELRPEKHLIMTEACQEGGPHVHDWQLAERYAENIIKDFNNWTEAWVDWNLWLDKKGGPNHVGNYCSAPVLVDPQKDLVIFQPSYYSIGQFSRFIQNGAERIMCSSSRDVLETTAFANPDGTTVVVVLNQGSRSIEFCLDVDTSRAVLATSEPHSITTYVFR